MNPVAKRTITALTIAAAIVATILLVPMWVFPPVFGVVLVLAAFEFYQLIGKRVDPKSADGLKVFVPGLIALAIAFTILPYIAQTRGREFMLYVIAIVKISDMGGFAAGLSSAKFMKGGNHKLCPTISPNKSWEGLGGSVLASLILSWFFMGMTGFGFWHSALLGLVAALVGTAGDLVESKFKRWAGVKDSSTMSFTNGMGGILDMFDSLLFAPAVIWALM